MNLPNSLTLLRIFFVPLLIVVLLTRSPNVELWGFHMRFEFFGVLILLAAAATDWADGYFARRRLQVTTLGILLDPIADKLLISAAFIALVDMHLVPAWMVVIIIGREFTVLGLRNIASAEGFTISASALGKTKMVLQVVAVAVLIGGSRYTSLKPIAYVLAGGGQRFNFRRAIFFPFLEPARQPHYPAQKITHDGSARQVRGCRSFLIINFPRRIARLCLRWRVPPSSARSKTDRCARPLPSPPVFPCAKDFS
jgi:CDP-diacylglycerol--glycerol-3-phosphate 3-phosphatidyltransferase